jgi:hypothetical protein
MLNNPFGALANLNALSGLTASPSGSPETPRSIPPTLPGGGGGGGVPVPQPPPEGFDPRGGVSPGEPDECGKCDEATYTCMVFPEGEFCTETVQECKWDADAGVKRCIPVSYASVDEVNCKGGCGAAKKEESDFR